MIITSKGKNHLTNGGVSDEWRVTLPFRDQFAGRLQECAA
jgi:hypothetical protein